MPAVTTGTGSFLYEEERLFSVDVRFYFTILPVRKLLNELSFFPLRERVFYPLLVISSPLGGIDSLCFTVRKDALLVALNHVEQTLRASSSQLDVIVEGMQKVYEGCTVEVTG